MTERICVVTGSRAEFGLLLPVINELIGAGFETLVVATGSHFSTEQGNTSTEFVAAGVEIRAQVPLNSTMIRRMA